MKTKHNLRSGFLPVLALGLLSAGSASAQNYKYFYQNAGSGALAAAGGAAAFTDLGTLASGFDMEQYNDNTNLLTNGATAASIASDTTAVGVQGYSTAVTLGTGYAQSHAVAGESIETITSVTLYLYASSLSPNNFTGTFQLYSGLIGRDGVTVGSTFSGPVDPTGEGKYFALTIPISLYLAANGVSIGAPGSFATQTLWNTVTQIGNSAETPGIAFNTTVTLIPETSSAVLGAVGSLILLRRRRA